MLLKLFAMVHIYMDMQTIPHNRAEQSLPNSPANPTVHCHIVKQHQYGGQSLAEAHDDDEK
jgi:hypothetical protein